MGKTFQNDLQHKPGRKPYIKPQIETVPLLPRQTVLGSSCYSASQTVGPVVSGCLRSTNPSDFTKCVL